MLNKNKIKKLITTWENGFYNRQDDIINCFIVKFENGKHLATDMTGLRVYPQWCVDFIKNNHNLTAIELNDDNELKTIFKTDNGKLVYRFNSITQQCKNKGTENYQTVDANTLAKPF